MALMTNHLIINPTQYMSRNRSFNQIPTNSISKNQSNTSSNIIKNNSNNLNYYNKIDRNEEKNTENDNENVSVSFL
jgi:hypothetical protein